MPLDKEVPIKFESDPDPDFGSALDQLYLNAPVLYAFTMLVQYNIVDELHLLMHVAYNRHSWYTVLISYVMFYHSCACLLLIF